MAASILIVDDEPSIRKVLAAQLARFGYEILTAEDGETAVAMLADHPVDVVITDLKMPGISGLELLAHVHELLPGTPVLLITALLIKLEDGGPVLFAQERCGLYGRRFKMYKFRSMVINAEEKLRELQAQNEMQGPVFKMARDPRITRVGAFIRKFSIDEFPQFYNVFKGEMSLVGPRPPIPDEVKRYARWQMRRLSMRPGLTCIWQVTGRNNIVDFDTWMRLDLDYIDNWSLFLDIRLMLLTVPVVVLAKGAR